MSQGETCGHAIAHSTTQQATHLEALCAGSQQHLAIGADGLNAVSKCRACAQHIATQPAVALSAAASSTGGSSGKETENRAV